MKLIIENLKLNALMRYKIFFIDKQHEKEKLIKYIKKYESFLNFFDVNVVFLSVRSAGITIESLISALGDLVGLITEFN